MRHPAKAGGPSNPLTLDHRLETVAERVASAYWVGIEAGRHQGRQSATPVAYRAGFRWGFGCGLVALGLAGAIWFLLGDQLLALLELLP